MHTFMVFPIALELHEVARHRQATLLDIRRLIKTRLDQNYKLRRDVERKLMYDVPFKGICLPGSRPVGRDYALLSQ
jgi:hypothetical protein